MVVETVEVFQIFLYCYLGGAIGAIFFVLQTLTADVLSKSNFMSLQIASQLATVLVFEHFGWMDNPVKKVKWTQILGVLLMTVGVFLITYREKIPDVKEK